MDRVALMNPNKLNTPHDNRLAFSKILTEDHSYYWDDKLQIRAYKTHPQSKKQLPLLLNWRQSKILKGVENGTYRNAFQDNDFITTGQYNQLDDEDQMQWQPCREYGLNHKALKWINRSADHKSILNDVRLRIHTNHFDIILSGILIAEAPQSRLKLIVEVIKALHGAGIIKGNWTDTTRESRPYRILKEYFHVDQYEIRIDSGRYGLPFYFTCKKNSPWTEQLKAINMKQNGKFNQVSLFSPNSQATKDRGYSMVIYDRFLKPENENYDPGIFPVRLEIKLHKKILKGTINDIIKGNAEKIIQRFHDDLERIILRGIKSMKSTSEKIKARTEFDIFINGKKTKQTPTESFRNLLKHGSFIQAIENIQDRVSNVENILKYHGLDLPKQRGLKVI